MFVIDCGADQLVPEVMGVMRSELGFNEDEMAYTWLVKFPLLGNWFVIYSGIQREKDEEEFIYRYPMKD